MSEKTVCTFPGQGSQRPGMGEKYIEHEVFEATLEEADRVLNIDLPDLLWHQPKEVLSRTSHAQPALLAVCVGEYRLLREKGFDPDCMLGHSLGEYSALVCSGVLSFVGGLRLVEKRGQLMEDCEASGGMMAVLGLDYEEVREVLAETPSPPAIANYNTPRQLVLSGEEKQLELAENALGERKAKCLRLDVSGPFHTDYMEAAEERLSSVISSLEFSDPEIPVLSGVSGERESKGPRLKRLMQSQMTAPVRWVDYLQSLESWGATTTVEVGPGEVLTGMTKRTLPELTHYTFSEVYNCEF